MLGTLPTSICIFMKSKQYQWEHILSQLCFFHTKLSSRFIHGDTKRYRSFMITSVCFTFRVYIWVCCLISRLFPVLCYYKDRMAIPFTPSLWTWVSLSRGLYNGKCWNLELERSSTLLDTIKRNSKAVVTILQSNSHIKNNICCHIFDFKLSGSHKTLPCCFYRHLPDNQWEF